MSTSNTSLDTQDQEVICNLLSQRGRFLSLLTPSARYTPVSPYPNYTKAQLDMRRKVEILQYKKNTTQLYQTTKSQKWSQLANANSNRYIICNKNPYVPSPSSACDVPGPLVYLSYDPSVPLYNYATNQNAYGTYYTNPEIDWEFKLSDDINGGNMIAATESITGTQELNMIYKSTPNTLIGTLIIQNIKDPITTYTFTIPIGLFATGNTVGIPSSNLITMQIIKATLNVYFYSDYNTSGADTPLISIPITNALTNTNMLDLSMSFIPTVTNGNFSASQYIGDIVVPNIKLNTEYGFLYDFRIYMEMKYSQYSQYNQINNATFGVYTNMPYYDTSSIGCIVTPQIPSLISKYLPCSLTTG